MLRLCGTCHEAAKATSVKLTREGWIETIDRMKAFGAAGIGGRLCGGPRVSGDALQGRHCAAPRHEHRRGDRSRKRAAAASPREHGRARVPRQARASSRRSTISKGSTLPSSRKSKRKRIASSSSPSRQNETSHHHPRPSALLSGRLRSCFGSRASYLADVGSVLRRGAIPDVRASTDPAVIAQGEYLVYGPAHCVECHASSFEEFQKVVNNQKVPLQGGTKFAAPPLGAIYSKNLTPDQGNGHRPVQRWPDCADDALQRSSERAVVGGADDAVPQHERRGHDRDHLVSARAAAGAQRRCPKTSGRSPEKSSGASRRPSSRARDVHPPKTAPEEKPTVQRGEYLARYVANCVGCHTPLDDTTFEPSGPEFSGGEEFEPMPMPGADMQTWFSTRRTSHR